MTRNEIIQGDALEVLRTLPGDSVQCGVTSPPYWGLRDYGVSGQIGLEKTIDDYLSRMVEVFREVKRVIRPDGTLWMNMGDSYATGGYKAHDKGAAGNKHCPSGWAKSGRGQGAMSTIGNGLKPKDLCMVPARLAMALQADGWWLRSMIPWLKTNAMPESVKDRPASAVEYVFLLTKSARYYYDAAAVRLPGKDPLDDIRRINQQHEANKSMVTDKVNGLRPRKDKQRGHARRHDGFNDRWDSMTKEEQCANGRTRRNSDWFFESFRGLYQVDGDPLAVIVNPKAFAEAHFATFPPDLIRPMILAGSRPGDVVLDPFMGAGTTALVCEQLDRKWIGIELNPEYIEIAERRLKPYREQQRLAI